MDFSNNDRTLAHSRSYPLNGTRPHVTNGENAGHRGFVRRWPTPGRASSNETRGIGIQTISQPLGVRRRADHDKETADLHRLLITAATVFDRDRFEPLSSAKRCDLAIRPKYDVRRSGEPLNEVIRHRAMKISGANDQIHPQNARAQEQSSLPGRVSTTHDCNSFITAERCFQLSGCIVNTFALKAVIVFGRDTPVPCSRRNHYAT